MKNSIWKYFSYLSLAVVCTLIAISSCKKDDSTTTPAPIPPAVTVISAKSGATELAGTSNADKVSLSANIIVTFSKAINPTSASDF